MCARTGMSSSLGHFRKSTAWLVHARDLAAAGQISFRHSILLWIRSFLCLRYEAQPQHWPSEIAWCQREEAMSPEFAANCAIGWERKRSGTLNLTRIS